LRLRRGAPDDHCNVKKFSDAFGNSSFNSLSFAAVKIEQLERKVGEQARLLDEQRRILDDLTLYSMAFHIYDKLKYLHPGTLQEWRSQYGAPEKIC
jgi:hypothetical protein